MTLPSGVSSEKGPGRGLAARVRLPRCVRLLAATGFALATGAMAAPEISLGSGDVTSGLLAQAVAYEHGEGVAKDPLRAAALYCEAARSGDAEAQFSLGWMYANGRGIARDNALAASLFALAAEQGHAAARKASQFIRDEPGRLPDCMLPDEPVVAEGPQEELVDPFADLPPKMQKIADLVNTLAPAYTVAPRLALAVITVESNFDPNARSHKDARGLMQLIPGTAIRFRVKNAFDVRDNVRGGLAYLRWLLSYYRGDVALAAAAYNAGEGAVDRYRGVPPYPETRSYVQRVLALFGNELHPYDPKLVAPAPFVTAR